MVVVPGRGAGAEEVLALGALQRVRVALRGEPGERAIDGGEADPGVVVAERRVQRLRAHEAARVGECFAHPLALPGVPLDGHVGILPAGLCARPGAASTHGVGIRHADLVTRPRREPMTRQTT